MSEWNTYRVWRKNTHDGYCPDGWVMTSHNVKARTNKEAQTRLRRMFANAGFTAMSLVAVPSGQTPA